MMTRAQIVRNYIPLRREHPSDYCLELQERFESNASSYPRRLPLAIREDRDVRVTDADAQPQGKHYARLARARLRREISSASTAIEPERWQRVKELFEAALQYELCERLHFLGLVCGADIELYEEVVSLLASHEQAGSFIATPAIEDAAHLLFDRASGPHCGQLIGRYRLLTLLGRGGMGEVYLATDTELGREVALKLLPAEFLGDAGRVKRFEREAKLASTLNHPNILTIYEIGRDGDTLFIATEFVRGQTLRHRLAAGAINLTEAVDTTIQVVTALGAAHGAGIVHRDIKPENVMLRPDGYVKVLDFGLAKPIEAPLDPSGYSTRLTRDSNETAPGALIGTFRYMSPEQARGQRVDARSDIWSLGVALYEMTFGFAPFDGETPSDIIAAILLREPPLAERNEPELQNIMKRALTKERQRRYQSADELLCDLQDLKRKLERRSEVETSAEFQGANTTAAVKAPETEQNAGGRRRSVSWAALAALLSILAISTILGAFVQPTRHLPPSSPLQSAPPERVISYALTVRKMKDGNPLDEPFEASDRESFENGWKFQLRMVSPQARHLYLLKEGPASEGVNYRILFPVASINHGSVRLAANEPVLTGWRVFDDRSGVEKLWIVWATLAVSALEAVGDKVNPIDQGVVGDPERRDSIPEGLAQQASNQPATEGTTPLDRPSSKAEARR